MLRRLAALIAVLGLAACTNVSDLDKAPAYLGNFALGHNVVVAPNLTKGPASRDASKEEWIEAMKTSIDERFGRYEGAKLYHLGISVEGYVLAIPGIPLVAAPKSVLIVKVTAWDDARQVKLNLEPETITVIESISGNTIISSGLTQSKEKQMENLSRNAAKQIQNWLVRQNNEFGWFEDDGQPALNKPQGAAAAAAIEAEEAEKTAAQTAAEAAIAEPGTLPPQEPALAAEAEVVAPVE